MTLTIKQLLGVPTLRTTLVAGMSGIDSTVLWAHSCELPKPWEWLGRGDLLMTTGHNVPQESAAQVAFLECLAGAGVSGLVVAEGMSCPPILEETRDRAEELSFAVLETAYEIPFVAIARVVAASDQGETQARMNRVLRVYDSYRVAVQTGVGGVSLLHRLSVELGHALHVVDVRTRQVVLDAGTVLDAAALAVICGNGDGAGNLPGITRLRSEDNEYMLLPIGTHPGWVMVADVTGVTFDLLVLQHVNTIVTIEAERLRAEFETRLAVAASLMDQLIAGDVDSELVRDRLVEFDVAEGPWQVVTAQSQPPARPAVVQAHLAAHGITHLVHQKKGVLVILTDGSEAAVEAVSTALPDQAVMGVSDEVTRIRGVADAVRQADWAREACRSDGQRIGRYGRDRPLFLPSTLAEAEKAVNTVLGALIDYDERHGTDLVNSLRAFFEANRSWRSASQQLKVHKQTLVYRMRRVSEVTGRRLDDLDDISELHLALRARQVLRRE